jgi:uncharacterized small protein (DUF1192 family)
MSDKHLDRAEVLNLVYTGQADAMADAYARLMADFSQMTAWGRGLEHDKRLLEHWNTSDEVTRLKAEVERLQSIHSIDSIGIEQLKAEVERLTSDLQMEKENEDRLVREWQRANNEVYGLQRQVAALIDNQTRLEALTAEMDKTINASQAECRRLKAEVERMTKAGDEVIRLWSSGDDTDVNNFTKALWVWTVAKKENYS